MKGEDEWPGSMVNVRWKYGVGKTRGSLRLMEYEDTGSWACSSLSVTAIDDDGFYQHTSGHSRPDILPPRPKNESRKCRSVERENISRLYGRDVKRKTIFDPFPFNSDSDPYIYI